MIPTFCQYEDRGKICEATPTQPCTRCSMPLCFVHHRTRHICLTADENLDDDSGQSDLGGLERGGDFNE